MKAMKDLIASGERLLAEADALREKNAPDADVKAKCTEFDALQADIEQVKADNKRRKLIESAKEDDAVDTYGKDLRDPAEPRDHNREEYELEQGFYDYVKGKDLSDQLWKALEPKSASFKSTAAGEGYKAGVKMPARMIQRMFGAKVCEQLGIEAKGFLPMGGGVPSVSVPSGTTATGTGGTVQTVPPDFRAMLLEMAPEPTYILPRATVVPAPMGSVFWPILRQSDPASGQATPDGNEFGGVTGQWIQEGELKPSAEAMIDQLKITTYEYAAYTELTNRLLSRSAIQLEPLLTRLFRDNVMDALDRSFLIGNGSTMPLGVCQADPTTGLPQARIVARDTAGIVNYQDLVNLEYAILPYHRKNAIWTCQDQALKSLKQQKSTSGFPLWTAGVMTGFTAPTPAAIIGYPFISTVRLPAVGKRGDMVFGDWSHYIVAMEEEVVVQRSEHYKFKNNVTAFRMSVVVGGKPAQPRAFAILDNVVGSTTGSNTTTTGGVALTTSAPD